MVDMQNVSELGFQPNVAVQCQRLALLFRVNHANQRRRLERKREWDFMPR